jgi:hypothetical protein
MKVSAIVSDNFYVSPRKLLLALSTLLFALVIEAVNLYVFMPPLDVDSPPNMPWYARLIQFQWVIIHLPGIWTWHWVESLRVRGYDLPILFTGGYLSTTLLLLALSYLFRRLVKTHGSQ